MTPANNARERRRRSGTGNPASRRRRSRVPLQSAGTSFDVPIDFRHPTRSRGTLNASPVALGWRAAGSHAEQSSPHRTHSSTAATGHADQRSLVTDDLPYDEFGADVDALQEVIMAALVTDRGAIGCAYYVAQTQTLHFMEDSQVGGVEILDALKLFIDPTVVLVSTKCNSETIDLLDPEGRGERSIGDDRSRDQTRLPYLLESRPNVEFSYDSARNKLANLRIGQEGGPNMMYVVPGDISANPSDFAEGDSDFLGRQGQFLRLAGWINLESRLTVGCAGAVLAYLQRRRAATYLPGDRNAASVFRVGVVEAFTLRDSMFVNTDTTSSLHIKATESHPNAHQQGPMSKNLSRGNKEGLSVYGLFHNLAKTQQGRSLLRRYFLRPSLNLQVINERLDTIDVLLRTDNSDGLDSIISTLSKVKNMHTIMVRLRKGVTHGLDKTRTPSSAMWQGLRHFLFSALNVIDLLNEIQGGEHLPIRVKIVEKFDTRLLAQIGQLITETIDFDTPKDVRRCIVRAGLDEELDEAQETYDGIEDMLSHVVNHIAGQIPARLRSKINVIFFPQIGFLISMEFEDAEFAETYSGAQDDPWTEIFATESHTYYKNSVMTEMDERFGDIYGHIREKEIEILQGLAQRVLDYEDLLTTCSDLCGELDCLVALARGATLYNLTRPHMSEDNIIKIRGGRHIIQELMVSSFVTNDTYLVGGHGQVSIDDNNLEQCNPDAAEVHPQAPKQSSAGPKVILLTGPNYSGKSIYLKQVAIIVYMAHVGCFVPAEAAKVGLTDKILTRIATRESVSRVQSAFMIDLQQMSVALSLATRRSLLIIDEFGKGTESCDGAGLVAGVFEHLLKRGAECPKVLGATHFYEIFESGFLKPRPALAFAHMQVKIDEQASDVDNQVTYLYNYCSGRSISSFGTICAALNGVPEVVTDRAELLIRLAGRGDDLVETCAELPDAEQDELKDAEQMARDLLIADAFKDPRKILDDLVTLAGSTMSAS